MLALSTSLWLVGRMLKYNIMLTIFVAVALFSTAVVSISAHDQCSHGEVRLVNGSVPSEGRVEVCVSRWNLSPPWGTVCDDYWGINDAKVICTQLNYTSDDAQPLWGAYFGRGKEPPVLDNVHCTSNEAALLDCRRNGQYCYGSGGAGVRCKNDRLRVKNISTAITVSSSCYTMPTIMISWEPQNIMYRPSSFKVRCFNDKLQHSIEFSVDNETFTTTLGGLLPSATYYVCCVSAVYGSYVADEMCSLLKIPANATSNEISASHDNRTSIVGGVLGFIIAVLLILLAICGGALLYLLTSKRSAKPVKKNTMDMSVGRNISYATTPSHSTTSGPQAITATGQGETGPAAEYSNFGPSYETLNSKRQQPVAARNRVSARLSERYEFSDAHLAAAAGGRGGVQGEVGMDYEVPQNSRRLQNEENDEYSHLQH